MGMHYNLEMDVSIERKHLIEEINTKNLIVPYLDFNEVLTSLTSL